MTNKLSILNNNELRKIFLLTPMLYSKERGFTIWNLYNLIISLHYPENYELQKFNANNTASIFFGSFTYYLINKKNFFTWLESKNCSHLSEKIIHIGPFLYYMKRGYYDKPNYKLSFLSFLYQLIWSYTAGNNIIDKSDIYYKMDHYYKWYYVWLLNICGHFFIKNKI